MVICFVEDTEVDYVNSNVWVRGSLRYRECLSGSCVSMPPAPVGVAHSASQVEPAGSSGGGAWLDDEDTWCEGATNTAFGNGSFSVPG